MNAMPGFVRFLSAPMRGSLCVLIWAVLGACVFIREGNAADVESAAKRLLRGEYAQVVEEASLGMQEQPAEREWALLLVRALLELGRKEEVRDVLTRAMARAPFDLRLRDTAHEIYSSIGATRDAAQCVADINPVLLLSPGVFSRPEDELAAGRLAFRMGMDPKQVLEASFDRVCKEQPGNWEGWLASAELALAKHDFALAAKTLSSVVEKFPENPEIWFGLARAYAPSDRGAMQQALEKVFGVNPNHSGALLMVAGLKIDEEDYAGAEEVLSSILRMNPRHAEAHACCAVLAHLRSEPDREAGEREAALKDWPRNPGVPHLIGRMLSRHYRFREGALMQREALGFDPKHLGAKMALANDLLRLGEDEEGWLLAAEVQKADPYDVLAYNLMQLRDVLAGFRSIESDHFLLRMAPKEAEVYGREALELLERAYTALTARYGLSLNEKTVVEIFPDQNDFAIRTFGLPGGAGYLGVCFGRLITANSAAARPGIPANWQSILWHEFGHVVTLTMTRNKIPRWLSEGISVYEERLHRSEANPSGNWGERMKPRYRAMILSEELTPPSALSAAFLQPKTPVHLGFAYYESSLVVEWLVGRWGWEKVRDLLEDLGGGMEINAGLSRHFLPVAEVDRQFERYARELAEGTAPRVDWGPVAAEELSNVWSTEVYLFSHPYSYEALNAHAGHLIAAARWEDAKEPLRKLVELYPQAHEAESAFAQLARVHRELGETDDEMRWLRRVVDLCSSASGALERLLAVAVQRGEWSVVRECCERLLAVDPMQPGARRAGAQALEELGRVSEAIDAYRTLLRLSVSGSASGHFELGRLLHQSGQPGAKREILAALEEAPKFRAAYRLLLEMNDAEAGVEKAPKGKHEP
jgi:tetratricopeptide (TPR) repeat protein